MIISKNTWKMRRRINIRKIVGKVNNLTSTKKNYFNTDIKNNLISNNKYPIKLITNLVYKYVNIVPSI
jgi:hypothetical protein